MTGDVTISLGGASMRAYPFVVFDGLSWARMAIAADELSELADQVAVELPRFIDRILLIDAPAPLPSQPQAVAA